MLMLCMKNPFCRDIGPLIPGDINWIDSIPLPSETAVQGTNKELVGRDPGPGAKPPRGQATGLASQKAGGRVVRGRVAQPLRSQAPFKASLPPGINPQSHTQLGGFLSSFQGKFCSVGCRSPSKAGDSPDCGLWAQGEPALEK